MKFRLNIRIRLLAAFLLVIVISAASALIIGSRIIIQNIYGQAYDSVRTHMDTARYIYDERVNVIHLFLNHLSSLNYIKESVAARDRLLLTKKLQEVRSELGLDILNIADSTGRIIVRSRNESLYGDDVSGDKFVERCLRTKKPYSGSDIMGKDHLMREGSDLASQAFIKSIPTPMGREKEKPYEDRGLVMKAASPIIQNGEVIGVIYGAKLINNNFEFVDRIQSLVFKEEKINGTEIGSATVFLDDLRISTTVRKSDGNRAIGTQVSGEVYEKVFNQGELWLDKAFVVDNWYLSAYSPIRGADGRPIGILYVGLLEEKFARIQRQALILFIFVLAITLALAVIFFFNFIKRITTPLNALIESAGKVAQGFYNKKVRITEHDELGDLGSTFNSMIDAIVERNRMLREHTEKQIFQSEKLASLGRLASGIAHEINNPLTGILTYSSIMLEEMKDSKYAEDLKVIIGETIRCRSIVREMLNIARETKLEREIAGLNKIIVDSLSILERNVHFHNVKMIKELSDDVPDMYLDINQIKSVINNLAVNAADAMPDGGTLTVSTLYDSERNSVLLRVTDTGTGINEDVLEKIFDPFYTTKEAGKGTGLGLAVTYGIIKNHGGSIDVKTRPGEGTSFIITLPVGYAPEQNGADG